MSELSGSSRSRVALSQGKPLLAAGRRHRPTSVVRMFLKERVFHTGFRHPNENKSSSWEPHVWAVVSPS